MIASDGSYDHMGHGAWGLVVCTPGSVQCFSGKVLPGPGTNSSYRSEAYGLLAGLRWAYAAKISGRILHVLDNESVVKVYRNCAERGSSLACSQDVWDELIWYKERLGARYRVEWRRGHAEKRGGFFTLEDKANHLADGLASAGYDAAPDMRVQFLHGRRWHVRLGGLRPLDGTRSSARSFLGLEYLRAYRKAHGLSTFDVDLLQAVCGGKSGKSMWVRAESTKFMHAQLATVPRKKSWGVKIEGSAVCAACGGPGQETVEHLLRECRAARCVAARQNWFSKFQSGAYKTSSDIADFLFKRLRWQDDKCGLLYESLGDDDEGLAARFLTGFIPADFGVFLRSFAREHDGEVRAFLTMYRRTCSRLLWWPVWTAARESREIGPDEEDDTGYDSVDTLPDDDRSSDDGEDGVDGVRDEDKDEDHEEVLCSNGDRAALRIVH